MEVFGSNRLAVELSKRRAMWMRASFISMNEDLSCVLSGESEAILKYFAMKNPYQAIEMIVIPI